jgi:hypothetical protein
MRNTTLGSGYPLRDRPLNRTPARYLLHLPQPGHRLLIGGCELGTRGGLLPRLLQAIRQVLIRVAIPLHRTKTSAVVLQRFDDPVKVLGINFDIHGAASAF